MCVLTGRGLKDPETAIANNDGRVIQCAPSARRSRKRCWVIRRRVVRVPASSANLGPGLRLHGGRAGAAPGARGGGDGHASPSRPICRCAQGRENLCVRAFERLHPADGFTFRIRSEIPLSGGLGSSAAAIVAGLMAADHLFELDADLLAVATELEGHPDNVAAALHGGFVVVRRRAGHALRAAHRPGGAGGRARRGRAHPRRARRAARRRCRSQEAVFNVAHGALLTLGLARGDWDLLARGLQRSPAPAAPRAPVPALLRARRARRELGALGATISGAGPTVLVWCFYEQTGAVAEALAPEIEGWAQPAARPLRAAGGLRRGALSGEPPQPAARLAPASSRQPLEHLLGERHVVGAQVGPVVEDRASPARPIRRRRSRRGSTVSKTCLAEALLQRDQRLARVHGAHVGEVQQHARAASAAG